jgi:chromosome segregation ATPase
MSNPTLIAGFEDVMTFIKNQDLKIKSLEEDIGWYKRIDSDWEREGKKAIEENKKLKEVVEELKHDKEVLEARNEELEEELTEVKDEKLKEAQETLHRLGVPREEENKNIQKINDLGISSQWKGKHIRFESDEE